MRLGDLFPGKYFSTHDERQVLEVLSVIRHGEYVDLEYRWAVHPVEELVDGVSRHYTGKALERWDWQRTQHIIEEMPL